MPDYQNTFGSSVFIEEQIHGPDGLIGTFRLKPNAVLWRPKGAHKFYKVELADFVTWITSTNHASRIKC